MNIAIVGATGYTGEEILKILTHHKNVNVTYVSARRDRKQKIQDIFPYLKNQIDLDCHVFDLNQVIKLSDIVFLSLPHTVSMQYVEQLLKAGKKVIDVSADYRLKDTDVYKNHYKTEHSDQKNLKHAVYGLTEFYREEVKQATLIANPGCYPTSALLALLPLVKSGLTWQGIPIIDSKSGTSGAGRKAAENLLFSEVHGDFKAYKPLCHQHEPEMSYILEQNSCLSSSVSFVPHLLPVDRGILSTIYIYFSKKTSLDELRSVYEKKYANEYFVKLLPKGVYPSIKNVQHTNQCHIGIAYDEAKNMAVILSAIDNLQKGAAGQAVQNMNVMCGFNESEGLK